MKFMPSRLCSSSPLDHQHRHIGADDLTDGDLVSDDTRGARRTVRGRDGDVVAEACRVVAGALGIRGSQHRRRSAGVNHHADSNTIDRAACFEMAAVRLLQHHQDAAVGITDRQRAAGNEPGCDSARDILQLVAVLVAGNENEREEEPDGEIARDIAKAVPAGADDRGRDDRTPCGQADHAGEAAVGQAKGLAGIVVHDQQNEPTAKDCDHEEEQAVHSPAVPSRAIRARRVSRRGRRSTVSSRAGSCTMTSRRVSGVMEIQAEISSRVRPQPKQKPVFMSIEQTRMQGDSMMVT